MSYDAQGIFTRVHNWEEDRQNDVEIMSDRHDEEDDNFAGALNECFLRDGRVALSGNLNAGNFQIKNVAQGITENDAVNLAQVTEMKNAAIEEYHQLLATMQYIGDIKPSLQSANHGNWLLCDGQAVSRSVYAELFDMIGVSFGAGDGINTFNVPDYRGKFLRGLGGDAAATVSQTQAEGLPNITGSFGIDNSHVANSGAFTYGEPRTTSLSTHADNGYTEFFDASASNPIYGASQHVTPINQAVNWFIKAKGE